MTLTSNQVAEILNVSLRQVYYLIRTGKLKAFNVSEGKHRQHYRINQEDLDKFMGKEEYATS